MKPIRLATGRASIAWTYVIAFGCSTLVLGAATWGLVSRSIENQLRQQVEAEVTELLGDYRDDGVAEVHHDIDERIEALPAHRLRYYLQDPDGRVLFDPAAELPPDGWHRLPAPDGGEVLLRTVELDGGYRLGVGADLEPVASLLRAVRQAFFTIVAFAVLLGVGGSWWITRRFERRVAALATAALRVGAGDLSERLPTGAGDADRDRVAGIINGMLDRIELLVGEVKRVSTTVAHELRTPLTRVRNRLEALANEHPAAARGVDAALTELDRALGVFGAMLRIAEVEAGARRAAFAPFDLRALAAHVVDAYAAAFEDAGVQLRLAVAAVAPGADGAIRLRGDEALVAQALSNLLENALHHANARSVLVSAGEGENGAAWLEVTDDGRVLPPGDHAELFAPFHRGNPIHAPAGTGLGLSLVAAVARLHGGAAAARVPPGGGLLVRVSLGGPSA